MLLVSALVAFYITECLVANMVLKKKDGKVSNLAHPLKFVDVLLWIKFIDGVDTVNDDVL